MTIAIIQARLTSTRLPNKVLMQLGKYTAIELMYERVKRSKTLSNIVFAIPDNPENNRLADYITTSLKAPLVRGSEEDVLGRYVKAAAEFPNDTYVRLTADCPLICPEIIDEVVNQGLDDGLDYCSNTNPPTFPNGFDVEYFTSSTLKWLDENIESLQLREHVTLGLKRNEPKQLKLKLGCLLNKDGDQSKIRLTLDHPEDLVVFERLTQTKNFQPIFASVNEIIKIYKNDSLENINGKFDTL